MDGRETYRHAVRRTAASCRRACGLAGWDVAAADHVAAHQANARISAAPAQRLELPPERLLSNIATVGNTSASAPGTGGKTVLDARSGDGPGSARWRRMS
ncbi:3-oxoacyl-[acyl-carrier-protein] synthase III C-terminal domain-containing protein [Streptomyces sp. TRM 70351]|uniref:3-oxoacyl-[acyl-carrier-protein] synthase III C-terminal domain-containing protein n=1 Tax=Streptomyces sp. TRM 70351 TaxID=3116552 RepID=UPI002E7ABF5C|nr:3-oxoacyl-[acyl-carrier-protein] synthase III C-terminal domain-containing protein [Streptomyces sp. TRM 70351]MEE1926966.1 3-oxoacyl-[acyl-carrier-protein] synthase III C-terminal domain-containing protein [Streptomyces sp. TRM 70351]